MAYGYCDLLLLCMRVSDAGLVRQVAYVLGPVSSHTLTHPHPTTRRSTSEYLLWYARSRALGVPIATWNHYRFEPNTHHALFTLLRGACIDGASGATMIPTRLPRDSQLMLR